MKRSFFIFLWVMGAAVATGHAKPVEFSPSEMFRVPFGKSREMLSARVEEGRLFIPRSFTLDEAGHFYIYDSNNHRIARFSSEGKFEMELRYPAAAQQVFAHPDARQNIWLLVSDPARGVYYGVYDLHGKRLRDGLFSQFNQFRLHVDDDHLLHFVLSSDKNKSVPQTFYFDEASLLLKKENVAPPPENHHQIRRKEQVYFIDAVPGSNGEAHSASRITNESHRAVAEIKGMVVYMTDQGEIYTRTGDRDIRIYAADGSLEGKVRLQGLRASCASVRFDSDGNIYELDGIPDQTDEQVRQHAVPADTSSDFEDLHYTAAMPGMRLLLWKRQ